jgi:hypothetical protein
VPDFHLLDCFKVQNATLNRLSCGASIHGHNQWLQGALPSHVSLAFTDFPAQFNSRDVQSRVKLLAVSSLDLMQ